MKKTVFWLIMLLTMSAFCQKNKNLARVQRLDGIEVYILSEPLRAYETVTSVTTGIKAESILTGGLFNESITDKVLQYIRRARKQGATFDAVLYSGGKSLITIKFLGKATEKDRAMARVRQLDGVDVYVLSEPLQDYETVISSGGGMKWKSLLTAGLVNNSIEDDMAGYIRKLRASGVALEGIIYSGGKSSISFKYR